MIWEYSIRRARILKSMVNISNGSNHQPVASLMTYKVLSMADFLRDFGCWGSISIAYPQRIWEAVWYHSIPGNASASRWNIEMSTSSSKTNKTCKISSLFLSTQSRPSMETKDQQYPIFIICPGSRQMNSTTKSCWNIRSWSGERRYHSWHLNKGKRYQNSIYSRYSDLSMFMSYKVRFRLAWRTYINNKIMFSKTFWHIRPEIAWFT